MNEVIDQANLVIYASNNGRDGWEPVKPDEVPGWLKEPDVIGHLVAGETAMNPREGDKGSSWYRAEVHQLAIEA